MDWRRQHSERIRETGSANRGSVEDRPLDERGDVFVFHFNVIGLMIAG